MLGEEDDPIDLLDIFFEPHLHICNPNFSNSWAQVAPFFKNENDTILNYPFRPMLVESQHKLIFSQEESQYSQPSAFTLDEEEWLDADVITDNQNDTAIPNPAN